VEEHFPETEPEAALYHNSTSQARPDAKYNPHILNIVNEADLNQ
jgi:hypothetical protein